MKNRILLILMIVLSFVGIIWQLFSYMGVGLCYKFDLEGIPFNPLLDRIILWSLVAYFIINGSFLLLSLILPLILKRKSIRCWIYLASLIVSGIFLIFWEYNYTKLLIELPEHRNQLSTYLRGGYYTYAIGTIIIYVLLLWLNKARRKMMNVHHLDIAESENPSE